MSITAFKSITMAESCLLSQPSLFSTKTKYKSISNSNSNSNSFKPRNLSFPHTLSLNCRKTPRHSSLLTFVAQTSDWAQPEVEQEDGATWENEEEPKWGNEDSEEVSEGGSFEEASEEELKIFVGNLPFDVDGEQLAGLFEQFGTVEVAEVIYNRVTDRSRGFGFVTMSTSEEVEKAVEKLSGYELNGRQLTVNKAAPRGAPRPERTPRSFESSALKVYVGNLPWDVDNGRLEQIFSEHVKVENAWVVYDRESGRSRGFGFVTVSNEADVNDAIAALDGQTLDGRALRVNVAEDRARRSF